MNNGQNGERLSWGDALFMYLERTGMPLNIAGVSVLEGDIPLVECRRFIESKLPLVPRYYQRAVVPPFNIGFPSWEDDPNFDIRNHIRDVRLKRGTQAELNRVAGKVLSTVMDRAHPLWDITLVHGLKGDRMGMVIRAHHCLADGIAGVALMNVLLDPSPGVQRGPGKKAHVVKRQHDSLSLLLEGWIGTYSDLLQSALVAQSDLINITEAALGGEWPNDDFVRFLPELTAPTQDLFFNQTYQGPQRFACVQVPTAAIKAVRRSLGGTHNDVVLALITATIRRYAEEHGDKMNGRLFRMMVPVDIRGGHDPRELGNRISLLPVTVPLGIRSPAKLLAAVHERMDFLKRAHVAEWVALVGGLVGAIPAPLQALVGPLASFLPITPFNLVCTNVRGPDEPLYLLGRKMTEWYPYVPVGGRLALNCAIISYCGFTYFGFSGDAHAAPDLRRLESLLKLSAEELLKACGIRSARTRSPKPTVAEPAPAARILLPTSPTASAKTELAAPVSSKEEEAAPLPRAA